MKTTRLLCKFLAGLSAKDVSREILEDIRYKTLDWMGCVIGALEKESSKKVLEMVREAGGNPQSSAFGCREKTSMYMAAFSNGILGHTLEYDDVNKIAITHPGAIAVPAALAAAEYADTDFETYALGVVAGYEVMIRLGAALNPSHYEYWHTTGTCGTFAAAAAAGKVMGLDEEELARAMGIAATMASGLVAVFGTDAKLVNVGNAVRNGIQAAVLAKKGYSVPEDVFEKKGGYAEAVSTKQNMRYFCPEEGDELMILDSYYKLHASCGHTHSALDALQKIRKEHPFAAEEVDCLSVKAYKKAVELTGSFCCETELKAKFSMPYCLASMLVCGEVGLGQFTEEARNNPAVLAFRDRIRVEEDTCYTEEYPILRIESVEVFLKDGRRWIKEIELPEGKPSWEYIEKKYLSLCALTTQKETALRIKEQIISLTETSSMRTLGDEIRKELGDPKETR